MVKLVRNLSEDVEVGPDQISTVTILQFDLYKACHVEGNIIDKPGAFETIRDPQDSKNIIGFKMYVKDADNQKLSQAEEIAARYVHLLGIQIGGEVRHKHPQITKLVGNKRTITKTFTNGYSVRRNYDVDMTKLLPFLSADSTVNQRIALAYNGVKAIEDRHYSAAIRDFHIYMELSNMSPEHEYYRCLRNAVSHKAIDNTNCLTALKSNFGISLNKGDILSRTDPTIQLIVKKEANKMRELVLKHLYSELDQL